MIHSQLNPTNFVPTTCPRIVKTFQSTRKNCWYCEWIGEEYTVISSVDDSYLVHTWNGYGELIPALILKSDCKTLVLWITLSVRKNSPLPLRACSKSIKTLLTSMLKVNQSGRRKGRREIISIRRIKRGFCNWWLNRRFELIAFWHKKMKLACFCHNLISCDSIFDCNLNKWKPSKTLFLYWLLHAWQLQIFICYSNLGRRTSKLPYLKSR